MDIYAYLKKDHKRVSDLLNNVMATRSPTKRREILEEIRNELLLHAKSEQATFYAALENKDDIKDWIKEAESEHKEIEGFLEKLKKLSPDNEKWVEQFGEFKHCVSHHVEEEEGEIFKKAKKLLSSEQAIELAENMDALKTKIAPKMPMKTQTKMPARKAA